MAQFNADILLAVRGSEKAKREIEKLEASLDKLGKKANLDLSGQIRLKGEQSLLKERIKNFGILQKELKVSQEIARLANKQARQRGNANQYSGPIGPGQASPSRLSSSLAMRRNQVIQQRSRGLNQFPLGVPAPAQDPVRDQQRRAKIIEKNIALRNRVKAIARATAKIEAARDARLKGQNSVTNGLLKLNKATLEAARSEAEERGKSVAEQRELNNELKKTQQYSKPIGPEQAPGKGKARRGGGGGAGGGLAAGIGFPLLFGGGPGSVIGGAVGSAGGFGTQILLSAIGGIIDQAVAGVAKLGQALNPLTADIDAVVAAAGESGTAFEQLVKDLEKVAGKEKALAAATAQLATVIGRDGVSAIREFGDESAELGRVYAQTLSQISAAVADLINNSGILTALANRLERTNLINAGVRNDTKDAELTDLNQELTRANKGQGDRSINVIQEELIARQRIVQAIQERNIAAEAGAAIAKVNEAVSKSMLATAENELAISRINAGLENDKVFELRLQGIELKRNEEINQNILDLNNKQITRQQAIANQIAINSKAEADRNKLGNDRAKAQEALAKKAASEAERLGREAEQARKKELRVKQTLAQLDIKSYNVAIQTIQATEGEAAAIEEQLSNMDALLAKRIQVINLSDKDQRIKDKEIAIAREQVALEQVTLRNKNQEIALQKELNKLKAEQKIDAVQTGLNQELAGLSLGGNDQTDLLQEQANRYANTLKDINNQIEQQNLLIENTPTPNQEAINAATTQLDVLQKTKSAYEAMLPQIFAAEQAQLKYNQAFAAITPAVNSLVGGLQDVVAGTKTAEEAFADFLNTVADQLIQTAATMIAQYIAIGLAKAFAGLGSNSMSAVNGTNYFNPTTGLGNAGPNFGLAEGGYVTGPTKALVGEGGQPEYVIPESKMDGAMQRYSAGATGADVVDGPTPSGGGGTAVADAPPSITINGGVTQFGGNDYIRKDQLPAIIDQSSKMGEARTLRRLQMSPSSRRKIGI